MLPAVGCNKELLCPSVWSLLSSPATLWMVPSTSLHNHPLEGGHPYGCPREQVPSGATRLAVALAEQTRPFHSASCHSAVFVLACSPPPAIPVVSLQCFKRLWVTAGAPRHFCTFSILVEILLLGLISAIIVPCPDFADYKFKWRELRFSALRCSRALAA